MHASEFGSDLLAVIKGRERGGGFLPLWRDVLAALLCVPRSLKSLGSGSQVLKQI